MRRYAERPRSAEFDRCSILFRGGQLAGSVELWCRVLWWTVVAGPLLRVELVFGETQEEQLSGIRWNGVACRVAVIVCAERSSEVLRSKLLFSFDKSYSHCELKLPHNLDLQTQCE